MNNEHIIERFSKSICLKDSPSGKGITLVEKSNQILKTIMIELVKTNPLAVEDDFARYFSKQLIEYSQKKYNLLFVGKLDLSVIFYIELFLIFCQQLIFSYLQPICFYAAKQMSDSFKTSYNLRLHYPLEDCFLIACEAAIKSHKLLKNFDFNSSYPLYGYARVALRHVIQNRVAKEMGINSLKFSDSGLLRQFTPGQLNKALLEYGFSSKETIKYGLVWQSFQYLFDEFQSPISSDRQSGNTLSSILLNEKQIEQLFNRFHYLCNDLSIAMTPMSNQEIKRILTICVRVARNFQNKQLLSIERCGELSDLSSNPFEKLIKEENKKDLAEFNKVIIQKFRALDCLVQRSILLWLGLDINQDDLISFLHLQKQYQVARQFQYSQKKMLLAVIKHYSQYYSSNSMTKGELNDICNEQLHNIKEYLIQYSQNFFSDILVMIVRKNNIYQTKREIIEQRFVQVIEQKLKIDLEQFNSGRQNISRFIDQQLKQYKTTLVLTLPLLIPTTV